MAENLEQITVQLPVQQVRWLRSKAELHGGSLAAELRRVVHLAITVENLTAGPQDISYVSVSLPKDAAA